MVIGTPRRELSDEVRRVCMYLASSPSDVNISQKMHRLAATVQYCDVTPIEYSIMLMTIARHAGTALHNSHALEFEADDFGKDVRGPSAHQPYDREALMRHVREMYRIVNVAAPEPLRQKELLRLPPGTP